MEDQRGRPHTSFEARWREHHGMRLPGYFRVCMLKTTMFMHVATLHYLMLRGSGNIIKHTEVNSTAKEEVPTALGGSRKEMYFDQLGDENNFVELQVINFNVLFQPRLIKTGRVQLFVHF